MLACPKGMTSISMEGVMGVEVKVHPMWGLGNTLDLHSRVAHLKGDHPQNPIGCHGMIIDVQKKQKN